MGPYSVKFTDCDPTFSDGAVRRLDLCLQDPPPLIQCYCLLQGVRMWSFAVGMFMIDLSPDTLRLTAIYGLAGGLAITLTGPIMGNWVDRYPRMKGGDSSKCHN